METFCERAEGVIQATTPVQPPPENTTPILFIKPSSGWKTIDLAELWRYRELLYFLVWRDIKVRYKQTALGVSWALMQPVLAMLIFTLFFGKLARMPSDGLPYPLWNYAGLVPWLFFAQALSLASDSLVSSANLLRKIYFPRLVIPIAAVCAGLVDFAISFSLVVVMMCRYGVPPSVRAFWLPLLLLLALVTALGVGLWLSAINVKYRDVRYTVPFLLQFWMFATPVVYPSSLIPDQYRVLYGLNPMAGVIEGFRWALLGARTEPSLMVLVSAAVSIVVLVMGLFYFRRMERTFADTV